jgi:hypothetical protein
MRRLFILLTVALFAFAPLAVLSVAAEGGWTDEAWEGVTGPEPGAPVEQLDDFLGTSGPALAGSLRERLGNGYVVTFEHPEAHIPEIEDSEFMAVYVDSGEFVLDIMGPPTFIVDPDKGRQLQFYDISGDAYEATYTLNEASFAPEPGSDSNPCETMCSILPSSATKQGVVAPDKKRVAVQLLPGDWVIAPAGGICLWCLLNSHELKGETTGKLFVYPLDDGAFSWIAARSSAYPGQAESAPPEQMATPVPSASTSPEALSDVRAWAFFNPAPNCRGN